MTDLRVTAYEQDDELEILQLFFRVFKENRSLADWRWENKANPHGPSSMSLLKTEEDIVGHLCVQPTSVQVGDLRLRAGQRIASMLDEKYRGQGHYESLLEHLREQTDNDNISFTYSFPNDSALSALKKTSSGLHEVTRIPRFVKFYGGIAAARAIHGRRFMATLLGTALQVRRWLTREYKWADTSNIIQVDSFDERFDHLWQRCRTGLDVATVRNSEYLNWRYIAAPKNYQVFASKRDGVVNGYAVALVEDRVAFLLDILAEEEEVLPPLLAAVDEHLERAGCHTVTGWCLDDGRYSKHLRRNGFIRLKKSNPLVINHVNTDDAIESAITDPERWYVTLGDSDYY